MHGTTTQLSKFDYTYNAVGTIATWTQQADSSTAVVNTLSYDNADQLTGNVQTGGAATTYGYGYDPAGNRLTEAIGSGTTAGQFNNLNQLKRLSSSTTSQTVSGHTSAAITSATVNAVPATISSSTNFTANVSMPAGTNVVSVVAQPTATTTPVATQRYQVVTSGSTPATLAYDANGNVTTDESGNQYQWDALNRLVTITYSSGATSNFAYDGLSRRVSIIEKNSSGTVTSTKNYLWIGSEIAEERDASNTVTKRFFPQGEQQIASGTATPYYYTRDHLTSTREMCSSTGAIVARYSYDPYGRTTLVSGTNLATFQYAGYYAHQTSGLLFTSAGDGNSIGRPYDPTTGRWLSRDSIGENGGLNLYGYVGDNPINYYDPSGTLLESPTFYEPVVDINPFFGAAFAGYVVGQGINAIGESTGAYNAIAQEIVKRQLQKDLKTRTHQKPPNGLDPCELARWNLDRLQDILKFRQLLAILHSDAEPNHMKEIVDTEKAIAKLAKWIEDNCDDKPPCP